MRSLMDQISLASLAEEMHKFQIEKFTVEYSGSQGKKECNYIECSHNHCDNACLSTKIKLPLSYDMCDYLNNFASISLTEKRKKEVIPPQIFEAISASQGSLDRFLPSLLKLDRQSKVVTGLEDLVFSVALRELKYRLGRWENDNGGEGVMGITCLNANELLIGIDHTEWVVAKENIHHEFKIAI